MQFPQSCRNVAMAQTALHDQSVWAVGSDSLTAQHTAQRFNLILAPVRQIGERSLLNFVAVAIALLQHNRGRGVSVGNAFDVHGKPESRGLTLVNRHPKFYMGTKSGQIGRLWPIFKRLAEKSKATSA